MSLAYDALIFDFDGVLLESEYVGNAHVADYLTGIGHPTTAEDSMANFMGLAGQDFLSAIEGWIGRPLPDDFHHIRAIENQRVLDEGVAAVAGAIAFIDRLPANLPRAIASSSSTEWITRHLDHIGLRHAFPPELIFSGKEHVERGKPAPDLYLLAARMLGVDIDRAVIIEDSPVGVTGAVASGATVIGICAGSHCGAGHGDRLKKLGAHHIAGSFDEVAELLGL